jgi:putative transcriptional regulator
MISGRTLWLMVKIHLSRLMGERKLKISDVARDTGLNRGTITRLYHETAERVELEVIDKLCRYLDCTIADLLEVTD